MRSARGRWLVTPIRAYLGGGSTSALPCLSLYGLLSRHPHLREIDNNDSLCPGLAGPPSARVRVDAKSLLPTPEGKEPPPLFRAAVKQEEKVSCSRSTVIPVAELKRSGSAWTNDRSCATGPLEGAARVPPLLLISHASETSGGVTCCGRRIDRRARSDAQAQPEHHDRR